MAETAAQKKAREEAEGNTASPPSDGPTRNTLTDDMPQPPGVAERKRRVARKTRKGPFVKYVGAASVRVITPTHWNTLGFQDVPKDGFAQVEWTSKNDYMVESKAFSNEQLDYLLIDDMQAGGRAHSFLEVDYDSDGQLVQVIDDDE
jgi:hypothetical protein